MPWPSPVVADGLGDGQDVGLGERAAKRRAAMAAGAEADQLVGVAQVGLALEILAFELATSISISLGAGLPASGEIHIALPFLAHC